MTEPQTLDSSPTGSAGSLLDRVPGQAVMAECLRAQADVRPRSRLARLLGTSPLAEANRPWLWGARGEREVGRRLARLGADWTVLHTVPVGANDSDSDSDHVAIGPKGVFTLNTKNHSGQKVWVGGRTFRVNGQRQPHLRNAEHEAERAARLLTTAVGRPVEVKGAIVVVEPESLNILERPEAIAVVTSRGLIRWLTKRRDVLSSADVAKITAVAAQPTTWHRAPRTADKESAVQTHFGILHREVLAARHTRSTWRIAVAAGLAAMLLAGLTP